jgi:hypothetical protein
MIFLNFLLEGKKIIDEVIHDEWIIHLLLIQLHHNLNQHNLKINNLINQIENNNPKFNKIQIEIILLSMFDE